MATYLFSACRCRVYTGGHVTISCSQGVSYRHVPHIQMIENRRLKDLEVSLREIEARNPRHIEQPALSRGTQ